MMSNKNNSYFVFFCVLATALLASLAFSSLSLAANVNIEYSYDSINRLTNVYDNSNKTAVTYNYDKTGNITDIKTAIIPEAYALTITKTGAGAGTVASNPEGISCGGACQADFASGAEVTLTATAATDSVFTGWSGACTGTGVCVAIMDAAKTINADFALKPVIPVPPVEGLMGAAITLEGSNFGATQGEGYVDFNGKKGTITSWADNMIVVKVPQDAESGCLKVVTDHGDSACADFTVLAEILYGAFSGAGIWKWNGKTWTQTTPGNPDLLAASGAALYGSFPGAGLWIYDGATWTQATINNPQKMATVGSNLYGSFADAGLWKWNGETWTQTTPSNPDLLIASAAALYGSFPGAGLWIYDGATWTQATINNPQKMATVGSTLYGSFADAGLWKWSGENWTQTTPGNPDLLIASETALYGSFPGAGLWIYDGVTWRQTTTDNPQEMITVGATLYGSFADVGLWKWNGETWMQTTPDNPQQMITSKNSLYGVFPGWGIWKYKDSTWTQLTPDQPDMMVVGEGR